MRSYVERFRRCLLSVVDAAPAEVLDRFIRGLAPSVRQQVLVAQPADFAAAALIAERIGGVLNEVPRGSHGPGPQGSGPVPMELGQMQGG